MLITGRRMAHKVIASGTDEVVAWYPLPKGCTLKNVYLDVHMIGPEGLTINKSCMYGLSGFVVPILDPDAETSVETLWDNLVPKDVDSASGVFDLDTGNADTTPEYEIGTADWTGVFGVAGNEPLEIFRRRRLITLASNPIGFTRIDAASDEFIPTDRFSTKVKRNVKAQRHSYILFGVSSPDTLQTTATIKTSLAETEWPMMTFMEDLLVDASKYFMGLIEAGAETPYVEIATFVAELLEATPHEETASAYNPVTWNTFCNATFQVDVPGRIAIGSLSSE